MRIRFSGNQIEIQTPAKVNLFLEILGRREDGFHQLETIISSVSLFDTLRLRTRRQHQIRLHVNHGSSTTARIGSDSVPGDQTNLVYRALDLVRHEYAMSQCRSESELPGVDAWIDKRIPSQAGLGGASSNAAGALIAANQIWQCGFDHRTLCTLGARLGSDVPFFLTGGIAVCSGRGEKVKSIRCPARLSIVVAKPPQGLSTADVYRNCQVPTNPVSSRRMVEELSTGITSRIGKQLFNRLESVASEMTVWIGRLKSSFSRVNCLGHQMTGSGSSYFGLFSNRIAALQAAHCLSNRHPDAKIFACQTLGRFRSCLPPGCGRLSQGVLQWK